MPDFDEAKEKEIVQYMMGETPSEEHPPEEGNSDDHDVTRIGDTIYVDGQLHLPVMSDDEVRERLPEDWPWHKGCKKAKCDMCAAARLMANEVEARRAAEAMQARTQEWLERFQTDASVAVLEAMKVQAELDDIKLVVDAINGEGDHAPTTEMGALVDDLVDGAALRRARAERDAAVADIARLIEAAREAIAICPVCNGTNIMPVNEQGISWDESCGFCSHLRALVTSGYTGTILWRLRHE